MDTKTAKQVDVKALVSNLIAIGNKAKLDTAKALQKAIKQGAKPSQIARVWKESDTNALNADSITKYALAYGATLNGADFDKVLSDLNSNKIARGIVVSFGDDDAEIPSEYQASNEPKENKRNASDPMATSQKALDLIVQRVKDGKITTREGLNMLAKAHNDLAEFAKVTGAKVA
jgi:hypothetical protein